MNWNMIYLLTANNMPMDERLGYALRMLIVGLGMVFVVLALLWGVLELSRVVFYDMPRHRREEEIEAAHSKAAPAPVAPTPAPVPAAPAQNNNDVLIAVITAAISAAMAEEGTVPAGGFRVVSFRRSTGNHPWNRT